MSDLIVTEIVTDSTTVIETVEVALQGPRGVQGEQGIQGIQGIPGEASMLTAIAGIAIGGHKAMVFESDGTVIYADQSIPSHAERVLGISVGAADVGDTVTLQIGGELIEPSWAWNLKLPIYLGINGMLTQVLPTTGFIQQIAIPLSATSIKFISQIALILE